MTATQVRLMEERQMAKPSIVTEVLDGIRSLSRGTGYTSLMTLSILMTALSGQYNDINVVVASSRIKDHISRMLREYMSRLMHFREVQHNFLQMKGHHDVSIRGTHVHFLDIREDRYMMGQRDFVTFFDNVEVYVHPNHLAELQKKIMYSHMQGAIVHGGTGFYFPSLEGRVYDMWWKALDIARYLMMEYRSKKIIVYGGLEEMVDVARTHIALEYTDLLDHNARLEIIANPRPSIEYINLDRIITERQEHDRLQKEVS